LISSGLRTIGHRAIGLCALQDNLPSP